jgi:hypothetical protein
MQSADGIRLPSIRPNNQHDKSVRRHRWAVCARAAGTVLHNVCAHACRRRLRPSRMIRQSGYRLSDRIMLNQV